jgi:hypothetical protein
LFSIENSSIIFFLHICITVEPFFVDLERFCGFCFVFPHQDSISEIAGKCYKSYTYAVPMEARRAWLACTVRESEREVAVEVVEELITLRVSLNMLEGATGYVSCVLFPLLSGNEKNTTTTTTMKKGSPSGRSLVRYVTVVLAHS